MNKPPVIGKEEKLACSLVSQYSYNRVKDVIDETCVHQHLADAAYYEPLIQQAKELEEAFELRHKADIRAISTWRGKHSKRKRILPDHADMVVWLLERLDKFEDTLKQEIAQNLPKAFENEQAKEALTREIKEGLEKRLSDGIVLYVISKEDWQAFWDKHLKG